MLGGVVALRKAPRTLHCHVDPKIAPTEFCRVGALQSFDALTVDNEVVAVDRNFAGETSMDGIVFQQMGVRRGRSQIVDGDNLDILASRLKYRAKDKTANAAKSINGNANGHRYLPLIKRKAKRL